jgi:hypothetical protein
VLEEEKRQRDDEKRNKEQEERLMEEERIRRAEEGIERKPESYCFRLWDYILYIIHLDEKRGTGV